jgi:hypothetical protein
MQIRLVAAVLLATFVGLATSGAARAADWQAITADDGAQVYVDTDSVAARGTALEAVVLSNYFTACTLGDDWFPHRSRVLRYPVACASGTAATTAWSFKSGALGGGETVWTQRRPGAALVAPAADTVDGAVLAALCSGPLARLR